MGTPHFAVPILKSIFESSHKIFAVYTQPPKKKSRGQKVIESPIHSIANDLNLEVRCPENLQDEDEFNSNQSFGSARPGHEAGSFWPHAKPQLRKERGLSIR